MTQTLYTNKDILKIAFPILASLLMEQLIGMTDTAFLGRVGEVEIGASAIAGIFYIVIYMVAYGFSLGAQILMARRNGEQEYRKIGELFYQGIYFQLALATVMFFACLLLSPYLLRYVVTSDHIYQASLDYLNWRIPGFFFSFTTTMFSAFYIATTQTKILTLNSSIMVLSNVVFNYILIFGKLGCPAFGISGAAMGSSLSGLVSLIFFSVYTHAKIDKIKYGLNKFPAVSYQILRRILNVSFWTMIQNFISLSTWFILFLYIEHLGERSLAITNIIRSIYGIPYMVVTAFAATCSSVVSNLVGAGHADLVRKTIHKHIKIALSMVAVIALVFVLFPDAILSIYTDIPELRTAAIPSLYVVSSATLIMAPGYIYFHAVSGTGNTRTAFALELITLSLYLSYTTYVVYIKKYDVAYAWTSEYVYTSCILTLSYFYIKSGKWKLKQI